MVWLQGINENQVSVSVLVVALFNTYVYTRTYNSSFLILRIIPFLKKNKQL